MNWSLRKQIKYFLIVFSVFAVIAGLIIWRVFFTNEPTCFDGVMNADEENIDCGGRCDLACREDTRDVIELWSRALPVTDNVYNVVAYLDNQNLNAGVRSVPYEFKIYDNRNILIGERQGSTYIGPNQRSAIFESGIKVGSRAPALINFEFLETPVWSQTEQRFRTKHLTSEDIEVSQLFTDPKIIATIRNNALFDMMNIEVVVLVYNEEDNAIATSKTFLDDLSQGSTKDVIFTWPEPFRDTPTRYEIISRISPFEQPER